MLFSLKTKLSLSYILIILICVLIMLLLADVLLESQFKAYVMNQQEQKSEQAVSLISQRYQTTGDWDVDYIEDIGMNALENGLILKVSDSNGMVVWDATTHNSGLCQEMLTSMSVNMQSRYAQWEGGYEEKDYDIKVINEQKVGTVSIGYYGPYYFTDRDLYFINTINSLLIWSGVVSVALALVLGVIMSRQISRPISRVIDKAQMIAGGVYGNKIYEKSRTKEIKHLVDTVNNLADTLKKQQDFSRQTSLDISHELRTPLTTIQGNLEAVLDGVMELDINRIKVMHDEVLRINRLVDDLSKLARYESKDFHLVKEDFDVSRLIKGIINNFENDFAKQNKTITFDGEKQIINADKDKINQVFVNMISNALKFTKPYGKLEINVKDYKRHTKVVFKDDGIGIAEEDLPNVFERFYRVDKSRSRHTGGAGIGLAIAKTVILAHGGDIEVESELGAGSEFIITIPKAVLN